MSPRKNFSSAKGRDDKPKRAFKGNPARAGGDKPAFKKSYSSDSSFSKDKEEKGSFRNPSTRSSRPDYRERKPFRRPEGKFGDDKRRSGSKPAHSPRNPKWEARPDWKRDNNPVTPKEARGTYSRDKRSDEWESKPFRRPGNKFGDDTRPTERSFGRGRRDAPRTEEGRERNREDRPERTTGDDARAPRVRESRDARPDRESKPFRKPTRKSNGDSRPSYKDFKSEERPERTSGEDTPAPRVRESRDARPDDRERKPYRKPEGRFGDDTRPPGRSFGQGRAPRERTSFSRDARPEDGEKKWNRKADSEFYGDKRKAAPRGRGFDKKPGKRNSTPLGGEADDGLIRLNKFISNAGICSRREADEMIEAGVVSVNGEVVVQLGYKVKPEDVVKYNNEVLKSEKMVYLLLNKPKDFITTADDPEKRKTVMTLIANACKERVYPVGRLDRNTTGLLLMTNDGDLTRKLTHPSFEVQKIYQAELDRAFKPADMMEVEKGLHLEDGFVKVDAISYVGTGQDKAVLGVELHSGKNRIVRRIFEHLGYEVKKLDRVYFAGISKKDLPRGRWRFLSDLEVASLKIMTGSKKFKNLAPVEETQELE